MTSVKFRKRAGARSLVLRFLEPHSGARARVVTVVGSRWMRFTAVMPPLTQPSLIDYIKDVLDDTDLTNPADVAKEILARTSAEEQLTFFAHILPAYVSSKMSAVSTSVTLSLPDQDSVGTQENDAGEGAPANKTALKYHGKPWYKNGWNSLRLNGGTEGEWILWPDLTLDQTNDLIERLDRKIAATIHNRDWVVAVRDALVTHGVEKVADLPDAARIALEHKGGAPLI